MTSRIKPAFVLIADTPWIANQATTAIIGAGVGFADDWDLYHRLDGEVHCGTEVVRMLFGFNWWENQP
ncbi:MAG: hypothetical protein IID34_05840 [Planctomycetes bacterium]|nr:hypothetical protein [Planctomycetota bacterium]